MANTESAHLPVAATIAAANVSGELFRAGEIARRLALAAKNSQAMVLRAGSRAAGLQVISGYFAELANSTIELSREVNLYAITISNNSVAQWRTHSLLQRLNKTKQSDACTDRTCIVIEKQLDKSLHKLAELQTEFRQKLQHLESNLEEIESQMRASNVIAVNFRLEATQTGEYQPMLNHMADNIDGLSNQIKKHVDRSQEHMEELKIR